ncbi:MAG: sugar-transfer associated ATP-grasp domain-containing protein, partial [Gammaproteobacteria bacterium]
MFGLIQRLAANGVVGLNERNCKYIMQYNPRRLYPLVDDKLATKRLAMAAGLPVPELYGV